MILRRMSRATRTCPRRLGRAPGVSRVRRSRKLLGAIPECVGDVRGGRGDWGGFACSDARLRAHARARAYVPCRGRRTAQHAHPCPGPARSPRPSAPIPLRLRARNRRCMHRSFCGVYTEFIRSLYGVYTGPSVTIYASPHQIQGPQPRGGSGCGPGRGPFTPSGRPAICMHTVIRSRPRSVSYQRYTLRHEAGMGVGGRARDGSTRRRTRRLRVRRRS